MARCVIIDAKDIPATQHKVFKKEIELMTNPQDAFDDYSRQEEQTAKVAIKQDAGKPPLSLLPASFFHNLPVPDALDKEYRSAAYNLRTSLEYLANYSAEPSDTSSFVWLINALTAVMDTYDTSYAAATDLARVMEFGAKKYSRNNWRLGFNDSRLLDAAMRHLTQWFDNPTDDESGFDHRAHAMFEISALLDQVNARRAGKTRGNNDLI